MKRIARDKAPACPADDKAVHARAVELAETLPVVDAAARGAVAVRFDDESCTWEVRVAVLDDEYDISVPTRGLYALWCNGVWIGGTRCGLDDPVAVVAARIMTRIRSHAHNRDEWLQEFTL